jgi:hypothetical protein
MKQREDPGRSTRRGRLPGVACLLLMGWAMCGCGAESENSLGYRDQELYCTVVALEPDPANPSVLYAAVDDASGDAVYRSSDRGDTWSRVLAGDGVFAIAFDRARPEAVYVVGHYLHVSHDFGRTWLSHVVSFDGTTLAVDSEDSLTLYAGGSEGLFRSDDEGVTWSKVLAHRIHRVVTDNAHHGTVFAATDDGLWRTLDGGTTWIRSDDGVEGTTRTAALHPFDLSLLYCGTDAGVFISNDAGETWTATQLRDTTSSIDVAPSDPDRLYASHWDYLFTSRDGGLRWDEVQMVPVIAEPNFLILTVRADPDDPDLVYLATDRRGVLRGYDGGESLELARSGLPTRPTGGGGDCAPTNLFSVVMLGLPVAYSRRRWWRWVGRVLSVRKRFARSVDQGDV